MRRAISASSAATVLVVTPIRSKFNGAMASRLDGNPTSTDSCLLMLRRQSVAPHRSTSDPTICATIRVCRSQLGF